MEYQSLKTVLLSSLDAKINGQLAENINHEATYSFYGHIDFWESLPLLPVSSVYPVLLSLFILLSCPQ